MNTTLARPVCLTKTVDQLHPGLPPGVAEATAAAYLTAYGAGLDTPLCEWTGMSSGQAILLRPSGTYLIYDPRPGQDTRIVAYRRCVCGTDHVADIDGPDGLAVFEADLEHCAAT